MNKLKDWLKMTNYTLTAYKQDRQIKQEYQEFLKIMLETYNAQANKRVGEDAKEFKYFFCSFCHQEYVKSRIRVAMEKVPALKSNPELASKIFKKLSDGKAVQNG